MHPQTYSGIVVLIMRSTFILAFSLFLATAALAQQSSHVFILMLENRSDDMAMRYMPYLSGLANQYGRGLQAYSPSPWFL
jgi:hypothetical protein